MTFIQNQLNLDVHSNEKSLEFWKDIPGYEGLYQASSFGRVKRVDSMVNHPAGGKKTVKERVLVQSDSGGYCTVTLSKFGIYTSVLVHRMIAMTFIYKPEGKNHVNHIDGNKKNNLVGNLEWVTPSENEYHKYHTIEKIAGIYNLPGIAMNVENAPEINGRKVYGVKSQEIIKVLMGGGTYKAEDYPGSTKGFYLIIGSLKEKGLNIQSRRIYVGGLKYYKEYFLAQTEIA